MMRTWQRALRHTQSHANAATGNDVQTTDLGIEDYEKVGGVSDALNQHADEIFNALGDDDASRARLQRVAERLFCSLSERREGGPLTRRPVSVTQAALESLESRSQPAHTASSTTEESHSPLTSDGQTTVQAEHDANIYDVMTVALAFQEANLLVFSPPNQSLSSDTRIDISHESLLRQWHRLQKWIEAEIKSAQQYRRLRDELENNTRFLTDTHLDQAKEWDKTRRPNRHWAMRYDGAESAENSLLPSCLDLIGRSHAERERRRNADRDAIEFEQARARREVEAEAKRAREAEASAEKFRRRTNAARLAFVVALSFAGMAIVALFQANSAATKAKKAENEAKAERDVAEKAFASGFVRSLGHNEYQAPLNPIELNSLWELAQEEKERIHDLFLKLGLEDQENARHLRRRLEVAIQATVGLSDDRRAAIRDVLIEKLRDPTTALLVQNICVDVGLALRESDATFCALALKHVVNPNRNHQWLDDAKVFLADHVGSNDAHEIAKQIVGIDDDDNVGVGGFESSSDEPRRGEFHPELPVLFSKLAPSDATPLATTYANKLAQKLSRNEVSSVSSWQFEETGLLARVAFSYEAIAEYLTISDAEEHSVAILKRIGDAATRCEFSFELEWLAESFVLLAALPSADAGKHEVSKLLARIHELVKQFDRDTSTTTATTTTEFGPPTLQRKLSFYDLELITRSYVALRPIAISEVPATTAEIPGLVARACIDSLDKHAYLPPERRLNDEFRSYQGPEQQIRAFEAVAAFLDDSKVRTELVDMITSETVEQRRLLWLQLLSISIESPTISAEESDEHWRQAADRLLADDQSPEWLVRMNLVYEKEEFERLLKARRKIAKFAPESLRKQLEQLPLWIDDDTDSQLIKNQQLGSLCERVFNLVAESDVFEIEEVSKTASADQRVAIARSLLDPIASENRPRVPRDENFPTIIPLDVELRELGAAAPAQAASAAAFPSTDWWLRAHAFTPVADALSATESAAAARMILDRAESLSEWGDELEMAGFSRILMSLARQMSEADSRQLTQRIAMRFETIRSENDQESMLHAFRALIVNLPRQALVELLKWPNCVGLQRSILLKEIGAREKKKFDSIWEFVADSKESDPLLYNSFKSPPRRPGDEELRSGERFKPSENWDLLHPDGTRISRPIPRVPEPAPSAPDFPESPVPVPTPPAPSATVPEDPAPLPEIPSPADAENVE